MVSKTHTPLCRSPHGERGLKSAGAFAFEELFGRSPHGERGLKYHARHQKDGLASRSPHGERGLKFAGSDTANYSDLSLSSWRAWIEITRLIPPAHYRSWSLSSWRAWIEMAGIANNDGTITGRSPHGERGLKYIRYAVWFCAHMSLSSWRAWIEITCR